MGDEELAELWGDSFHSLIMTFTDSTPGGGNNVLLQESGNTLLQEDSSNILVE